MLFVILYRREKQQLTIIMLFMGEGEVIGVVEGMVGTVGNLLATKMEPFLKKGSIGLEAIRDWRSLGKT
jgi:hypothetical protein